MQRKWWLLSIAVVIIIGVWICLSTPQIFKSPHYNRLIENRELAKVINEATGKSGEIVTSYTLKEVTSLSFTGRSAESIDIIGLSNCNNLEILDLSDNLIEDIGYLNRCTKLKELYLSNNKIGQPYDISTLSELRELRILDLQSNYISDITPLASLTMLSELNLTDNRISDIKPLVENTGLSEGDMVVLENNPLSEESINTCIPQLVERGVTVEW